MNHNYLTGWNEASDFVSRFDMAKKQIWVKAPHTKNGGYWRGQDVGEKEDKPKRIKSRGNRIPFPEKPTVPQKFTSAGTSINAKRAPALFNDEKVYPLLGPKNLDYGGGKYDKGSEVLAKHGIENTVYDPYNRTKEHNKKALSQEYDSVTMTNVLNVIAEPEWRKYAVHHALQYADRLYIGVYEGDGTNEAKPAKNKPDQFQLNRKTKEYLSELSEMLPNNYSVKPINSKTIEIAYKGENHE